MRDMEFRAKSSHVPLPSTEKFSSDELGLIIGTCIPIPVAILDLSTGEVSGGNSLFEEYLGVSLNSTGEIRLEEFVHPDDKNLFNTFRFADFSRRDGSLGLRLKTRESGYLDVELHVSGFRWKQQEFLLLCICEVPDKTLLEKELRDKVAEQKRKTFEAIKSSLLIYQFTEKIKKTPVLTTSLLSAENEAELFTRAARILTSRGLNYKDVVFFLLDADQLIVCHSTCPVSRKSFPYCEESRYAKFIAGQGEGIEAVEGRSALVPLRSRGHLIGLIEVTLHPRERILFDEYQLVREWQNDALLTIGDMIALVLDNLKLYRKVKRQSITDPLTGVYNRNYFIERLSEEIQRCKRKNRPISMIFVDVDEFKEVNDSHGHLVGDEVLRRLGEVFRENVRGYDFVCRYGGDEFVILLSEVEVEGARKVATKLRKIVHEAEFLTHDDPPKRFRLGISLGVSVLDKDLDEKRLLSSADAALYAAKAGGGNRLVVNNVEEGFDR